MDIIQKTIEEAKLTEKSNIVQKLKDKFLAIEAAKQAKAAKAASKKTKKEQKSKSCIGDG